MKIKCDNCNKLAVWYYAPEDHPNDYLQHNPFLCDDCVPRGCSCNLIGSTLKQHTDEKGRLLPCCEYWNNEFGFDDDVWLSDFPGYEIYDSYGDYGYGDNYFNTVQLFTYAYDVKPIYIKPKLEGATEDDYERAAENLKQYESELKNDSKTNR